MDRFFQPLASSSYLVAIANIVALITAIYFSFKFLRWLGSFALSIYQNRVKEFFREQKQANDYLAQICVDSPSFFIAHALPRVLALILCIMVFTLGLLRMSYLAAVAKGVDGSILGNTPVYLSGHLEYNLYSAGSLLYLMFGIFLAVKLIILSERVKDFVEGSRIRL